MRKFLLTVLAVALAGAVAGEASPEKSFSENATPGGGPGLSADASADREKALAADLAAADAGLAAAGGREAFQARMRPLYEENRRAAEEGRSKWVGDAYYAAGTVLPVTKFGNFFDGIISLRDYLAGEQVDLIVVRVPSRQEVAFPHFVSGPVEPGCLDYAHLELRKKLLEAGVEYIDGLEVMHRRGGEYPLSYWYMLPNEGHPAEGFSRLLAEAVAERLKRYRLPRGGDYRLVDTGDLFRKENYPAGNPKFDPARPITAAGVVDAAGRIPEINEAETSPVLFISDSYGAYPGMKAGASIPHYVAWLTGHLPDWLYRSGSSGGTPTFLYRKGIDFIRGRRVVVAICHPGNLFGKYSLVPPPELRELKPENLTVLQHFGPGNWPELPSEPAVNSHGKSFMAQPGGLLRLHPLKADAGNGASGRIVFTLRPEWRKEFRAFAVRLSLARHLYLTVTVDGGVSPHHEYLSVSDRVKTLLLPADATGETLLLDFSNVTVRGDSGTELESIELLGIR